LQGRFGRGQQQTADGWPDFIGGRSRVVSLMAAHDRKSDVPVILYAEFTGVIFNQQLSSLIEEGASQLTFSDEVRPTLS
jgi:hypothetical protein